MIPSRSFIQYMSSLCSEVVLGGPEGCSLPYSKEPAPAPSLTDPDLVHDYAKSATWEIIEENISIYKQIQYIKRELQYKTVIAIVLDVKRLGRKRAYYFRNLAELKLRFNKTNPTLAFKEEL